MKTISPGLLMLSHLLMPTPTTDMVVWATVVSMVLMPAPIAMVWATEVLVLVMEATEDTTTDNSSGEC